MTSKMQTFGRPTKVLQKTSDSGNEGGRLTFDQLCTNLGTV